MQEAHWVDGFNGLQDLLPEPQGGAHGEGSPGLTPSQVGQVTALQQHGDGREGGGTILNPLFISRNVENTTILPVKYSF